MQFTAGADTVSGVTAMNMTEIHGGIGDGKTVMVITLLQRIAQLHQMGDRLMHQFNGVNATCGIAGVARFPLNTDHIRQVTFVRTHRFK